MPGTAAPDMTGALLASREPAATDEADTPDSGAKVGTNVEEPAEGMVTELPAECGVASSAWYMASSIGELFELNPNASRGDWAGRGDATRCGERREWLEVLVCGRPDN
ncbi:hypothetical protein CAOG_009403 [Capsaspora owczarzaki ATCC 30864]|uniref:Uncharacterized protein n=1 Tax=Capsaspora owczarzaki (strain ATCC 30864) TaxID=595528 RepID=A0A0D2U3U0_CAPO3|nr:hypothetical protein CAOG_009403 [Capsaspora owczarzaki ATCC 30864]